MKKAETLTKLLIKDTPVLHLATSNKAGHPSNCALEFVEKHGNFYWRSGQESEHSKNLTVRNTCSICITRTKPDGSGEGLQALGTARILKNVEEQLQAKKLLNKKITKPRSETITTEEDTREYWVFTPKKLFYMNESIFGYGRILITQSK